ncbi:MAG: HPr family phosphocarrier protein [Alphaproteobacteria bacterium]|nr:HPr family phosphocarrier protein [Alphaproteobacteria bacterium]
MPDFIEVCEQVTIVNQKGLHARAAAKFVKCAGGFEAVMEVSHGDMTVSANSIMGLMMLAASKGSRLRICACGADAEAALAAVAQLITDRFEEDE